MNYLIGTGTSSKQNARAMRAVGLALVVLSLVGCSKATSDEDSSSDSSSKASGHASGQVSGHASGKIETLSLGDDARGACYEAVLASHGLLSWSALNAIGNAAGLVTDADARAVVDAWPTSTFEASAAGTGADIAACRSL